MKNKLKIILIIWAVFSLLLLVLFTNSVDKRYDKLDNEYPPLSNDTLVKGIVKSFYSPSLSRPRNALCVELLDGTKFQAVNNAYPRQLLDKGYKVNQIVLHNFLEIGDSICKPSNIDTLYVLKDSVWYPFFYATKERIELILND